PKLSTVTGGLSGPCIKPIAVRMVWEVFNAVKIPIIGMGGISNWQDAIEFILAGSRAIQVGTYNFIDPTVSVKIVDGINEYLDRHNIESVNDLVGQML
ncbi:MAG TPA: dihydroorotate dehydrogenase, partial [Bacteroidales bacterium]|nr:dihydroorotate dehydrogenase [Bacteroidales bacterium]